MAFDPPLLGRSAPDFDLLCTQGPGASPRRAKLSDYRGGWLALVFYPRDFSLVCPTELTGLSARVEEFRRNGCELLGVSCDPVETHEAWIATPRGQGGLGGLAFPLAGDTDGSVCRAYGVYLEPQRVALRGLFLIDPNGVVQYQVVHNLSVGRRTEEVLRILAALQTGGLCPQDWEVNGTTLDPTRALGPGSVVAHYRIETQIGAGSFAAVFRARDTMLERTVALKVLKPGSPTSPRTILAEARLAAALNHPNVCTIYAVDDSEGVPVIAMEYLRGRPLSALIDAGPLAVAAAAEIGRRLTANRQQTALVAKIDTGTPASRPVYFDRAM
jgi:alkyl hydroperoxide reductase subunit AhpC